MNENELDQMELTQAIAWHLAYNFIPPQPPQLLEHCIQALEACNSGDSGRVISLPGGVSVTASDLVDDLKLSDLLEA
jgi:hypothetical protein